MKALYFSKIVKRGEFHPELNSRRKAYACLVFSYHMVNESGKAAYVTKEYFMKNNQFMHVDFLSIWSHRFEIIIESMSEQPMFMLSYRDGYIYHT